MVVADCKQQPQPVATSTVPARKPQPPPPPLVATLKQRPASAAPRQFLERGDGEYVMESGTKGSRD
jgi:hypothetical protein